MIYKENISETKLLTSTRNTNKKMKTKLFKIGLFALLSVSQLFAQDVTTVRANNSDISDNLDLQAVASIFGDSRDLEDFERRLNDPSTQISNLDLNGDSRVDYLRVIEATEGNTHVIILQSVLGVDTFQDVATIEVERDRNNNVTVQVVGDTYMYGNNYIYEPIYVTRPYIYDVFWVSSYRPYYSPWYWGYYPTYYSYWSPYPVYRYRNHIHTHINVRNTYNYVNVRHSNRAVALHSTRRANAYESQHPDRSFTRRNENVSNRYALEQSRGTAGGRTTTGATRTADSTTGRTSLNNNGRGTDATATRMNGTAPVRSSGNTVPASSRGTATTPRTTAPQTVRSNGGTATVPARANTNVVRSNPSTTTAPARTPAAQPSRAASTPVRTERSAPAVRSTPAPAVRNTPAPAVRNTPAPSMRSTPAPAPSRSSSSPSRSAGGSSRRG